MPYSIRTSDLITEVRQHLDEWNTDAVADSQIISALNRAQRRAVNILCAQYEDAFLECGTPTTVTSGDPYVNIPETAYSGRVEMIEYLSSSSASPYPVRRINYREGTARETSSGCNRPTSWAQVGRKIRLYPKPNTAYQIRIWTFRQPERIVRDQGRITNISGLQLTIADLGTYAAGTNDDAPQQPGDTGTRVNDYINVVDAQTGEVKGTYQIDTIAGGVITIDATPARTSVFGKTVSTSLSTSIEKDDIICNVRGTGVPELYESISDFLAEDASFCIKKDLGIADQNDYIAVKDLEQDVKNTWVGREVTTRITRTNKRWVLGIQRSTLYS